MSRRREIEKLCDAIVADINEMTDGQLLKETEGNDFEEVAQAIRDLLIDIVQHHKHKALL